MLHTDKVPIRVLNYSDVLIKQIDIGKCRNGQSTGDTPDDYPLCYHPEVSSSHWERGVNILQVPF